ncbi:MAG: hypothetical protein RR107_00115 [Clostridia bacterium]
MKKIVALLLVLTLALTAFAGCGSKSKLGDIGTTADILAEINKKVPIEIMTMDAGVKDGGLPTYGFCDLTEEEFNKLIVEGDFTTNAISSMYHHIIVLKFNDEKDVATYKEKFAKIVKEFPYVCGSPQAYYVNDSGNYLYFAITFDDYVDKFAKAFEELSGTFGKAITGVIE